MVVSRSGEEIPESSAQANFLSFLYRGILGRILLRLLRAGWLSRLVGFYMDSRFSRKRRQDTFPFSKVADDFCSPADSRLTVVPLTDGTAFHVKHAPYTVSELIGDEKEATRFEGGHAFVFRLSVEDYHRYAYPDGGRELSRRSIKGTFHTVNPIALEKLPVFHRNCREVSLLETEHFGTVAYVEVGAMMVGRIVNHGKKTFSRGEEKGYFAFGGSTVVILTEKGGVLPCEDLLANSKKGIETYVRSGETVGRKA